MSRKSKKQRKAEREAARAVARRAERRRNQATVAVLAVVVALGALLVWVSLDDEPGTEDFLAELEAETEAFAEPRPVEPLPSPQPPTDPAEDERPVACDAELPERAGETKPTHELPEPVLADGVAYEAVLETSCGTVRMDLDAERTPEGVNAFVFLATTGFYDGVEVFRHAADLGVLQTGSGNNTAGFQVGYHLPDELEAVRADGYPPGSVAYANAGPGTSGSQFFLIYDESFSELVEDGALPRTYSRFATVTEGLDVLERIAEVPVEAEVLLERVYLESVTVLADGEPLPTEHREAEEPEPDPDATPSPAPDDEE